MVNFEENGDKTEQLLFICSTKLDKMIKSVKKMKLFLYYKHQYLLINWF